MHGATMTNFRRQGIKATKHGKPNPEYVRSIIDGQPTPERLAKAEGFYVVGDDQQGTRVYHFQDTPLHRLYSRLRNADRSDDEQKKLSVEWAAMLKYLHHWHHAGLESSCSSIDLDRVFSSDPSMMSGMAKTERQVFHRTMYRRAGEYLMSGKAFGTEKGHGMVVLLDNFVCHGWNRGITSDMSPYIFRKTIRGIAQHLARHWGL